MNNTNNWIVYLLRCSDNTYYCGATNKLIEERIKVHNTGKGSKYTRARLPVTLIISSLLMSKSEALKLEHKVKKLPRPKKIQELTKIKDL